MKWLSALMFLPIGGAGAEVPRVLLHGEGENELAPHGRGNVYAPDVIKDGKVYRMWYGGQGKDGHDRISYAESTDGREWVRKGVVLRDERANHVNDPSVVEANGKYFMYYTHTDKEAEFTASLARCAEPLQFIVGAVRGPSSIGTTSDQQ